MYCLLYTAFVLHYCYCECWGSHNA